MESVAKVRFVNLKDYINVKSRIFDGKSYTNLPHSPTAGFD